jgi:hypothetical protein
MVNAVKRPYYWFPYGFNDQGIPVYEELYPNALKEVSSKKKRIYLFSKCTAEYVNIDFAFFEIS